MPVLSGAGHKPDGVHREVVVQPCERWGASRMYFASGVHVARMPSDDTMLGRLEEQACCATIQSATGVLEPPTWNHADGKWRRSAPGRQSPVATGLTVSASSYRWG